jgi:hypothetical protein
MIDHLEEAHPDEPTVKVFAKQDTAQKINTGIDWVGILYGPFGITGVFILFMLLIIFCNKQLRDQFLIACGCRRFACCRRCIKEPPKPKEEKRKTIRKSNVQKWEQDSDEDESTHDSQEGETERDGEETERDLEEEHEEEHENAEDAAGTQAKLSDLFGDEEKPVKKKRFGRPALPKVPKLPKVNLAACPCCKRRLQKIEEALEEMDEAEKELFEAEEQLEHMGPSPSGGEAGDPDEEEEELSPEQIRALREAL